MNGMVGTSQMRCKIRFIAKIFCLHDNKPKTERTLSRTFEKPANAIHGSSILMVDSGISTECCFLVVAVDISMFNMSLK